MYYCESCAERANVEKHFYQTYRACSVCRQFGVVYDHTPNPRLPKNAPLFTHPDPEINWGGRPRKEMSKAHGHFKWKLRIVRKPKELAA
jgi:hypothetical protein